MAAGPAKLKARALLVLFPFLLGAPRVAQGQERETAHVLLTAREVAKEGLRAYDEGLYDEAYTKLTQAYGAVKLPTLALYTARAAEKLGRLVRAAELYREAAALTPDPSWQAGQYAAQEEAKAERAELLSRIPRLVIVIENAPESVRVSIDDVAIPASLILAEQLVDPGEHLVTASGDGEELVEDVSVEEGETLKVYLEFSGARALAAGELTPRPYETSSAADTPSGVRRFHKLAGWITLGTGGALVATGGVLGIYLIWKQGKLQELGCTPEGHCYEQQEKPVAKYNTRRDLSTAAFIAGGVLSAAGVTLILTTPKKGREQAVSQMSLGIKPGELVLSGTF